MQKIDGKKIGAKRINIYATEDSIRDLDWLAKAMGNEYAQLSRSRVIRVLVEAAVAQRVKDVGKRHGVR